MRIEYGSSKIGTNACYVNYESLNTDIDNDGYENLSDNCIWIYNPDQANVDGDEYGDVCDPCPNSTDNDDDVDELCAFEDNCPFLYNPEQVDNDNDGEGDLCCCIGEFTGNADCSENEEPNISDITCLINYLYLSGGVLCCAGEADSNGSGGEPDIADITKLIDHLYISHSSLSPCPYNK